MVVRLDKIYTRGGDAGKTSLAGGKRVAKSELRIEALGAVDEANAVIGLARKATVPVQEIPLLRHDIFTADECFLTGTAAEVIPVVKLDGRPIGDGKPGPVTHDLRSRFQRLVRGEA